MSASSRSFVLGGHGCRSRSGRTRGSAGRPLLAGRCRLWGGGVNEGATAGYCSVSGKRGFGDGVFRNGRSVMNVFNLTDVLQGLI